MLTANQVKDIIAEQLKLVPERVYVPNPKSETRPSNLDKERLTSELGQLTWEELDWLERKCKGYKEDAPGSRVYRGKEAGRQLGRYFEDTFHKHHGY